MNPLMINGRFPPNFLTWFRAYYMTDPEAAIRNCSIPIGVVAALREFQETDEKYLATSTLRFKRSREATFIWRHIYEDTKRIIKACYITAKECWAKEKHTIVKPIVPFPSSYDWFHKIYVNDPYVVIKRFDLSAELIYGMHDTLKNDEEYFEESDDRKKSSESSYIWENIEKSVEERIKYAYFKKKDRHYDRRGDFYINIALAKIKEQCTGICVLPLEIIAMIEKFRWC